MNSKELIIIVLAILVAGCIIAGAIFLTSDNSNSSNINNTLNSTNNSTAPQDTQTTQKETTQQSKNSDNEYTYDPQSGSNVKNSGEDVDTGSVDKNGEKIYAHRWVDDGVVYESYKTSSGREISSEEYYN